MVKDDLKRHKCDFCSVKTHTEGFEGCCGHYIYACGSCLKEKTNNRTKEDHMRLLNE